MEQRQYSIALMHPCDQIASEPNIDTNMEMNSDSIRSAPFYQNRQQIRSIIVMIIANPSSAILVVSTQFLRLSVIFDPHRIVITKCRNTQFQIEAHYASSEHADARIPIPRHLPSSRLCVLAVSVLSYIYTTKRFFVHKQSFSIQISGFPPSQGSASKRALSENLHIPLDNSTMYI